MKSLIKQAVSVVARFVTFTTGFAQRLSNFLKCSLLLTIFPFALSAAPKSDLWELWTKHDPQSTQTIKHELWGGFLQKNLETADASGVNLLAYGKIPSSQRKLLEDYLEKMQSVSISTFNRDEQMAYWINLYNARTVQLILEHYPVESITKIKFGFFDFGPWDEKLLKVEGVELSLNDVEHRILRPIWKDARIHYVVNCASMGCPNLQKEAFEPANLEALLDKGAKEYVNHQRGAQVIGQNLQLSEIYEWYQEDFGKNEAEVIQHLLKYATPEKAKLLKKHQKSSISYEYDWALNEVR